jgi:hypothetical protein
MRTLKLVGASCILLIATSQTVFSQSSANRNLSNLTSPTSINQSLLPNSSCSRDLGSGSRKWRNLYLCGREGINISNPQYPLDIYNTNYSTSINIYNPYRGQDVNRYGIYSSSIINDGYGVGAYVEGGWVGLWAIGYNGSGSSGSPSWGVYGEGYATDCSSGNTAYGVVGNAHGAYDNYGVYGFASDDNGCGGFTASGYFEGDVYVGDLFYLSDRKFKANLAPLKSPLAQIMKLKPYSYSFKTTEYSNIRLPKGKHFGLVADEVKQVFPEVVKEAVKPAKYSKDMKIIEKEEKYEAVNLIEILPAVIGAIQEQQTTIDALKAENQELKSRLSSIEKALNISSKQSTGSIVLTDASFSLSPNPSGGTTTVSYNVPTSASNALLKVSGANGAAVKTISLASGKGQMVLNAGLLPAGTYTVSLFVSGQLAGSKTLVLSK